MTRWWLFIPCLFGLPGFTSQAAAVEREQEAANSSDELAERNAILSKVRAAIAAGDFAALSAMENEFRTSRARTPSGIWRLAMFHVALQAYLAEGLEREGGCEYRDAQFVQRWGAATPRNPAPFITDAALLSQQAWCFRGSGYADSVPADAWPKFRQGISAAAEVLDKHSALAASDPEYYAVRLDLLRAQGVSKATFHAVLDKATAREPYYHRTYFNAAWYYLPQWGGSYADVEEFARSAADRTRRVEKRGLYARIFWHLDQCGCHITERVADWPTLKQSMRDVYDHFPERWNGQYFADLSCRMGDTEEGHRYIKAIHPEATDDASFAALFAVCDNHGRNGG